MLRGPVLFGLVALSFASSLWAPLATYGLSLALFGGAHVAAELRFVDARMGPRFGRRVRAGILALLGAVVLLRGLRIAGEVDGLAGARLELIAVLGLGLLVLPMARQARRARGALAVALLVGLAAGIGEDPAGTMLLLAVLHNGTPLLLLLAATEGEERRRRLPAALLAFLVLPALMASGLPASWLCATVGPSPPLMDLGPLHRHLGVYLPAGLRDHERALDLFRAAVLAQCLHYTWVIGVLPGLVGRPRRSWLGLAALPAGPFALAVAGLSLLAFVGWSEDFAGTRAMYGLIAAVHAWIELPALLVVWLRPVRGPVLQGSP